MRRPKSICSSGKIALFDDFGASWSASPYPTLARRLDTSKALVRGSTTRLSGQALRTQMSIQLHCNRRCRDRRRTLRIGRRADGQAIAASAKRRRRRRRNGHFRHARGPRAKCSSIGWPAKPSLPAIRAFRPRLLTQQAAVMIRAEGRLGALRAIPTPPRQVRRSSAALPTAPPRREHCRPRSKRSRIAAIGRAGRWERTSRPPRFGA
jgi:hypothetical protein